MDKVLQFNMAIWCSNYKMQRSQSQTMQPPGTVQYNFSLPFQYDSLLCYTQVKVQDGMDKKNQTQFSEHFNLVNLKLNHKTDHKIVQEIPQHCHFIYLKAGSTQ